jgi:hypothetical protein
MPSTSTARTTASCSRRLSMERTPAAGPILVAAHTSPGEQRACSSPNRAGSRKPGGTDWRQRSGITRQPRADDLSDLPSAYIDVGGLDIFCEEALAYARRLTVPVCPPSPIRIRVYRMS